MPVTFYPSNVKVKLFNNNLSKKNLHDIIKNNQSYKKSYPIYDEMNNPIEYEKEPKIVRTSTIKKGIKITSVKNGFVYSCIYAYNNHHKLSIRPDDVWISILTQFSFYVNAYAEDLRDKIVSHKNKKDLIVVDNGPKTIDTLNYEILIKKLTEKIHENIKDDTIRDWIIPNFSTTTENDKMVASTLMMAIMQNYFNYGMCDLCGLPEVTLEGEKEDWIKLLNKSKKLIEFDTKENHMEEWYGLLIPVLEKFIECFDKPDLEFWNKINHRITEGSGLSYYTGWIICFCYFNTDGTVIKHNKVTKESLIEELEMDYKSKSQNDWEDYKELYMFNSFKNHALNDLREKYKEELTNKIDKIKSQKDLSVSKILMMIEEISNEHEKKIDNESKSEAENKINSIIEFEKIKYKQKMKYIQENELGVDEQYQIPGWPVQKSRYPIINTSDIPSSIAELPVNIECSHKKYTAKILTGQMCFEIKDNNKLCPRSDWCLIIDPLKKK